MDSFDCWPSSEIHHHDTIPDFDKGITTVWPIKVGATVLENPAGTTDRLRGAVMDKPILLGVIENCDPH